MAPRGLPSVVYLLILPSIIAHLCSCTRYANYNEYTLENEKICHQLHKRSSHDIRNATAAVVKSNHMFDRWVVQADRQCRFVFKTAKGEGLFGVVHKMFFRRNGTQCLDYIRFKRSDGFQTQKFCGEINRNEMSYFRVPEPEDNIHGIGTLPHLPDIYEEFDPPGQLSGAKLETEIFISRERVPDGSSLDLIVIYTPYRNCSKVDPEQYKQVGNNTCIRKEYFCDKIYNCPQYVCSDEVNCPYMLISDMLPRDDTATKVTVGAVTTMILCFIIFVMCLWVCKRSQKLCWSSDCAGPNVCSRPVSLPQETEGSANPAVPTAPMLEVAVSSPVADKDLPPSYDSLFPEQSNPARS